MNAVRNIGFVLLAVGVLVLKGRYVGPFAEAVGNWGGNVSISFAVYFIIVASAWGRRLGRTAAFGLALLAVQTFEATNGFGLMTNVYDPLDYAANLVGVTAAVATDIAVSAWLDRRNRRRAAAT